MLEQQTQCVYLVLVNSDDENPVVFISVRNQEAALHEGKPLAVPELVDPVDVVVVYSSSVSPVL